MRLNVERVNKAYVERLVSDIKTSIKFITDYTAKPYEIISDSERYTVSYHLIIMVEALAAL